MSELKPGIELDILVALHVLDHDQSHIDGMGETWNRYNDKTGYFLPPYSVYMAHAFDVFDYFRHNNLTRSLSGGYVCRFGVSQGDSFVQIEARAETAPLAICLAALKAVGELE